MFDIRSRVPASEGDYAKAAAYVDAQRPEWERHLSDGVMVLRNHLVASGHVTRLLATESVGEPWSPQDVALASRLKDTPAIVAKMRRFGEPLRVILDIWGYRVVTATSDELDGVARSCAQLWQTPSPKELLLRNGALQFDWRRDYRRRDHAGLSPATSERYDEAIHLNRRAPFGIVEIQVMTLSLYTRAHVDPGGEDSHGHFVSRRQALFADRAR